MKAIKTFNATTVALESTNLIEASAGTGKTYSIAILVLRLVIEKKLSVRDILMVTFTKAAVAELQERIRLFIRKAYKASMGEAIDDETIQHLVLHNAAGYTPEETQQLLRDAVLLLDETAVLTIHSFCQLTLTEFAFETNQLFGTETMQDNGSVIQDEVNKFWREQITTIPSGLLAYLVKTGLSRHTVKKVVLEHLSGKKYAGYDAAKTYTYCQEDHEKIIGELREIESAATELTDEMHAYVEKNADEFRSKAATNTFSKKWDAQVFNDPKALVKLVREKKDVGYAKKLFSDIISRCTDCDKAAEGLTKRIQQVISDINCQAINLISAGLNNYKQRNNLLSFDDMIVNLHKAFLGKRPSAWPWRSGRNTRRFSWTSSRIPTACNTRFSSRRLNVTPYCSISAIRNSPYMLFERLDIFTYFKAKRSVEHLYTMNVNFRSAAPLIEAMNHFFLPEPGFDSFHFNNAEESIDYLPVESPGTNKKGLLLEHGLAVGPITFTSCAKNPEIREAVLAQVIALLSEPGMQIEKNGLRRRVTPADIGILVRTRKQARAIKALLSRVGIPSVTIDEAKVLESDEALYLLYVLQAMVEVTHQAINKAYCHPLPGIAAPIF